MYWLTYFGIVFGTFLIMEGITWLTHRFVMHGFLWYLHEDHHTKGPGFFEKNDWFFVIFAVPSIAMIFSGAVDARFWWLQAIGFGVMAYGFAYFMVHEIIIHQRFKYFTRSNNIYIRAIRWAHKMHHKHLGKAHGESFGMLVVNQKYWDKVKKDRENTLNKK
jgi:beta-carotene 3-hydroxylase